MNEVVKKSVKGLARGLIAGYRAMKNVSPILVLMNTTFIMSLLVILNPDVAPRLASAFKALTVLICLVAVGMVLDALLGAQEVVKDE